jgi:hypothetical protein
MVYFFLSLWENVTLGVESNRLAEWIRINHLFLMLVVAI